MKRVVLVILIICLIAAVPVGTAGAWTHTLNSSYAYNYDYWGVERESPSPYNADIVVKGADLGIGNFRDPQGVFVAGERVFLVDTGNNRIIELDSGYNLVAVIDSFNNGGQNDTFSSPYDVFVTPTGDIYVADTNNHRIVHMNADLEAIKIITKPDDALMDEIAEFLPLKLVVDNADRLYLVAQNVSRGLMEFSPDGSFASYLGANQVNFSVADMIWRTISTRTQREQMALFIPTEYNNVFLDHKGFVYTTTSAINEEDLIMSFTQDDDSFLTRLLGIGESFNVEPVRRLNAMGADILIRNGWVTPIGDWDWSDAGGVSGPSRLMDIAADDQNSYYVIDRVRGRIFGYDFQGNILYIFGGLGNMAGHFQNPTAIEYINGSLLVVDSRSASMTVFNPTEYGALIHRALEEYYVGNYELSGQLWEQVLMLNANFDLAYIGIGRSLLRQGRFEEAMYYFEMKADFDNYSKAFAEYRKQVVEDNISYVVGGLFALIIVFGVYKHLKKLFMLAGKDISIFKTKKRNITNQNDKEGLAWEN